MSDQDQDAQQPPRETSKYYQTLQGAEAYIQTLPSVERRIALMAANGTPVWEIAQQVRESEGAVARTLDGVIAVMSGRTIESVETGGLGADTDPGITGGYGDTGFGALDTEPIPDNTEPKE